MNFYVNEFYVSGCKYVSKFTGSIITDDGYFCKCQIMKQKNLHIPWLTSF